MMNARPTADGFTAWCVLCTLALTATPALAADPLVQVQQDFSHDPGWEGVNNRIEALDPPTVTQDFGWSPGRIGGTVSRSTTPAWYGMPVDPPLSFQEGFSASGRIAVMPGGGGGTAYLGFFNHERQGFRPWSSVVMRVRHMGERAFIYIDYTTATWMAGAAEMELEIPTDGSEHTWRLTYDPDATRGEWSDPRLKTYLTTGRQTEEELLAKARQEEPEMTSELLRRRLAAAVEAGFVSYIARRSTEFWLLKQDGVPLKGAVTLQVDDGPAYTAFLNADLREQPVALDRFGIFNMQMNDGVMEFYASDLEINGRKIDLSRDPGWDGKGNRAQFVERDFRPRNDFGYSPDSSFAGGQAGEIGGQFYGAPHHGHYADDVGRLTLDDPIRFSGRISFLEGSTDAGMFFGFFNSAERNAVLAEPRQPGWPQPNSLGVRIDGPARIGWRFIPWCTPAMPELAGTVLASRPIRVRVRRMSAVANGPVFLPTREPRTFDFTYDPEANNGVGRISVTLDGHEPFTLDLTPAQRRAGATFDRFGLMTGSSAKYVTVFLDDLTYTARRSKDHQPVRHKQEIIKVPHPSGGGRSHE
jgi:hypothetical protein